LDTDSIADIETSPLTLWPDDPDENNSTTPAAATAGRLVDEWLMEAGTVAGRPESQSELSILRACALK
jgi:hypothetical protein